MYVEDNQANISLLQRIARMGGHQVINYTNGEHALTNFEQDRPDLVLMDLQLEGRVSGLEVVKQLRERGFKTPIVAVTAYAMVGDRERCIDAGCDSYLSKPLPVAELVELVQNYEQKLEQSSAVTEVVKSAKAEPPAPPAEPTAEAKPEPVPPRPPPKPPKPKHPNPRRQPRRAPRAKPEAATEAAPAPVAEDEAKELGKA
ncbi:MAG: response regulator [Anaerolineae bacterium]